MGRSRRPKKSIQIRRPIKIFFKKKIVTKVFFFSFLPFDDPDVKQSATNLYTRFRPATAANRSKITSLERMRRHCLFSLEISLFFFIFFFLVFLLVFKWCHRQLIGKCLRARPYVAVFRKFPAERTFLLENLASNERLARENKSTGTRHYLLNKKRQEIQLQ